MLHLIWSIIVGFFVGWIARAVMPGADHMGFWMTAGVGIVGSLIGGLIGNLISRPPPGSKFHAAGFSCPSSVRSCFCFFCVTSSRCKLEAGTSDTKKRQDVSCRFFHAQPARRYANSGWLAAQQLARQAFQHAEVEATTLPVCRYLAIGCQVIDRMRQHLRKLAEQLVLIDAQRAGRLL
jgi:uncharacterized membrane protein YeaQ/YmgE (transglycosylase-associated protein family)